MTEKIWAAVVIGEGHLREEIAAFSTEVKAYLWLCERLRHQGPKGDDLDELIEDGHEKHSEMKFTSRIERVAVDGEAA